MTGTSDTDDADVTWLRRAGRAFVNRELFSFLTGTICFVALVILVLAAGVASLAVPVQGFIEVLVWLKTAEWANYDWYWYLGDDRGASLTDTHLEGLNKVIGYVLNSWISLPFSIVGGVIITIFNDS